MGLTLKTKKLKKLVRDTVYDIGYEQEGYHWKKMHFECHLHSQSSNIAIGVDKSGNKDEGAGDQGLMFGYASNETDALMPAPIYYAHKILKEMAKIRHEDKKFNIVAR